MMNEQEIYDRVALLAIAAKNEPETRWSLAVAQASNEFGLTIEQVEAICDRQYDQWAAARGYDN